MEHNVSLKVNAVLLTQKTVAAMLVLLMAIVSPTAMITQTGTVMSMTIVVLNEVITTLAETVAVAQYTRVSATESECKLFYKSEWMIVNTETVFYGRRNCLFCC